MKYEYYWLRNYVSLISENQIKSDLEKRTKMFNSLGIEGWELLPSLSGEGDFCFRRSMDSNARKKIEYYWVRDFISLYSEAQIQNDMDKRSKMFNDLSLQGWTLVMDDLSMFCFIKCQ